VTPFPAVVCGIRPAAAANQSTQCNGEVAGFEIDYAKLVIITVVRSPSARDARIVVLPGSDCHIVVCICGTCCSRLCRVRHVWTRRPISSLGCCRTVSQFAVKSAGVSSQFVVNTLQIVDRLSRGRTMVTSGRPIPPCTGRLRLWMAAAAPQQPGSAGHLLGSRETRASLSPPPEPPLSLFPCQQARPSWPRPAVARPSCRPRSTYRPDTS
jgi:hypothetical protein